MRNLVSLRHLYLTKDSQMPAYVGCLTNLRTLPFFVVGPGSGHKIEELGCLKELRGELRVAGLEYVRDKKEAEGSDLVSKVKIYSLELEWSAERESNSSNMNDEDVLEGLQAHPDIRFLKIKKYLGEKWPSWLLMPVLNNLVKLRLEDCRECKQLPSIGHLPRLEILEIKGMNGVSCIGNEFYSSNGGMPVPLFPALKRFSFKKTKSLVEWMVPGGTSDAAAAIGGVQQPVVFPYIEGLHIDSCPKLKSIPSMTHLSSKLVELVMWRCRKLSHIFGEFDASTPPLKILSIEDRGSLASIPSLQRCTALQLLRIYDCGELMMCNNPPNNCGGDFPELQSLRRVRIDACQRLTHGSSLAISGLLSCASSLEWLEITDCNNELIFQLPPLSSCLRSLKIRDCPNLTDFPEHFFRGLTRLKKLEIGPFSRALEEFPVGMVNGLSGSLEELHICGWNKLKRIPHQRQHSTALKQLFIKDFNGEELEEALPDWLGNLSSLQKLSIGNCKNLKYAASSTAMQRLSNSNLRQLRISSCPLLERNCAKGSGSEWPKIMNIPTIKLNDEIIQDKKQWRKTQRER